MVTLLVVAKDQTRLRVCQLQTSFSLGCICDLKQKPAALKHFVFDWKLGFSLCEVYGLQNLVDFEFPIKHNSRVRTKNQASS